MGKERDEKRIIISSAIEITRFRDLFSASFFCRPRWFFFLFIFFSRWACVCACVFSVTFIFHRFFCSEQRRIIAILFSFFFFFFFYLFVVSFRNENKFIFCLFILYFAEAKKGRKTQIVLLSLFFDCIMKDLKLHIFRPLSVSVSFPFFRQISRENKSFFFEHQREINTIFFMLKINSPFPRKQENLCKIISPVFG